MIYVLHFLRGASWGLIFIGALFYFSYFYPRVNLYFLLFCMLPGIIFLIFMSLLIEIFRLKNSKKD